ncbi:NACHT, LRR and PYD domains-containing protein 3-like isoform X2 [Sparus aurata]|uniref:NACHT, LRR and PYD domains-containing protein 3-like isoform X2 n=1 Tax=Sparus aurata TaxID=8175 RepID=UPI0011C0D8FC|nr:NACHT, LRR and PYD domains-containing protein 3-like isoform X2 [Sparus aurata]
MEAKRRKVDCTDDFTTSQSSEEESVKEFRDGNVSTTSRAVDPETSRGAETQVGSSTVTAQTGGVISTPHMTGVNIGGDNITNITINNTVRPPNRTDETTDASTETKGYIQKCQADLKSYLEHETKNLIQEALEDESSTPLNKIYTELYITEGDSGEVNSEHEVVESECKKSSSEQKKINLNDIFKPLSNEENPPQRVLTKGNAGIGKTVAVQKFTHDWATGTANQTTDFIFPFTFRELNLKKDKMSLKELIGHYFKEVRDLETSDYDSSSILFIFDGLDESRLPLDFKKNETCRSITDTTTLDCLLTNLIKGKLLHKASVWITSRPAAATKIPSKFIHRVTEVQGFNDEQKEEYFQKKVHDKDKAQKILNHLQSKPLRSLYIMCHIPLFCWISATVLQSLLTETPEGDLPKTVTELYTHFLIIQTKRKNKKDYQKEETDKDVIMKLGKLAFEQLQKGNVVFYEDDLKSQIDRKEAAVYSGVFTQLIKKKDGLHKQVMYSFIHLTVQEFLAALYVLETFIDRGKNLLHGKKSVKRSTEKSKLSFLHKKAVDLALGDDHGRWDLFLRFLLGLSQEKNQELLQTEFKFKRRCPGRNQETVAYIHKKIKNLSSDNKVINLFHCLNELGDQSLLEQVQQYQNSGDVGKISPAHWSAMAFLLLSSNEDLDVFDLKKYSRSDKVLERLLPVLKVSKTALLSNCKLTDRCCKHISSVLSWKSSGLEELDLSMNRLQDSGVKLISDGLRSANCKLQTLRVNHTGLTTNCCHEFSSVLSFQSSRLKELDLSNNDLQDSGVKKLSVGLKSPHCKLETLRLSGCMITKKGCTSLASSLRSNPSHLRELDLTYNHPGDSGVKLPDCFRVEHGGEQRLKPGLRKYVCELTVDTNTVNRFLKLSDNNRKVTHVREKQPYPDHPERFDYWPQLLCRNDLTGRCYWEIEWRGSIDISVSYRGISRRGNSDDCLFGRNDQSWSLNCSDDYGGCYSIWHNKKTVLSSSSSSSSSVSNRVAVYVDCPAGTLSFYRVSDSLIHLHTFNTTFTEPLCPGLWFRSDSSVSLCSL